MKHSFTYYLTLLVIKLKGLKRTFDEAPINYKKLRKEDVHYPRGEFYTKHALGRYRVLDSSVTEIGRSKASNKLLIFLHGGAFVSGPAQHHWNVIKEIAEKTSHNIWMCDYPKAPEHQIMKISENIDAIYAMALKNYQSKHISIIGDSVGGTLAAALVQRLVLNKEELPAKVILVSPVMDSSMSNPEIEVLDKSDPMLSKVGVLSSKKMCAGDIGLQDPIISPLYGSFKGFPSTILCLSQNDIMYPDGKLAEAKMKKEHVNVEVIEGYNMPHIWPFLPVMKEAKTSLNEIIQRIKAN